MENETMFGEWIILDGVYGVSLYPGDHFCEGDALADYLGTDKIAENISKVHECETIIGWAARLSMPGYLDCTDWHGPYDTEREALRDLKTLYAEA
jgi:hypothetical protein